MKKTQKSFAKILLSLAMVFSITLTLVPLNAFAMSSNQINSRAATTIDFDDLEVEDIIKSGDIITSKSAPGAVMYSTQYMDKDQNVLLYEAMNTSYPYTVKTVNSITTWELFDASSSSGSDGIIFARDIFFIEAVAPPKTDKDKLDEAKPLAETAIEGITATNDTTAQNILDAVTTAIATVDGVTASWKENPTVTLATKENAGSITGTIVLTCGSETVEIVVNKAIDKLPTPAPEAPTIVVDNDVSDYQINSDKNMTFTCSANLEDLIGIYVDGNLVDESNYTLKSGSTILTLKSSYLDTLSVGKHTLKFQYNNDLSAETEFTITEKASEAPSTTSAVTTTKAPTKNNTTSPKTGDSSNVALFTGAFAVAGIAIAVLAIRKKKIAE